MRNRLLNLYCANAKRGSFSAEANTIYVYDHIVSSELEAEWFGGVTPKAVIEALAGMTGTVTMRINSPGGDVFAGNAIAQAMREYKGGIEVVVDGIAASAASVIATTAAKVTMAPGSMMMIHNAWTITLGDKQSHTETANLLEKIDGMLADHYAARAKQDSGVFAEMMNAETWFTPQEAVEAGLADAIAEAKPKAKAMAAWDLTAFNAAPLVTKTTTETTTTTVETEVEIETVEVISGDPAAASQDSLEQRSRRHAAAMLLKAA